MKMKYEREWKIRVPWGKLALQSCGHPDGYHVLLVHGRQDSSSVFEPLLEQLTDQYYFVALDMPGNGLSDAFPHGPKLMRFHFLYAMEIAVEHLGWDRFIFIGHSMGCEQGLFFNCLYPGRISKMILIDAGPTLMRMQTDDPEEYQRAYYHSYYENYHKENFTRKTYTKTSAIKALKRLRDLNDSQCDHLLKRNFHEVGTQDSTEARSLNEALRPNEAQNSNSTQNQADRLGQIIQHMPENDPVGYLSWDNRLKNLAPQNYGNDYYFQLFKTIPPTLLIAASDGAKNVPPNPKWRQGAKELLDKMATLDNFYRVDVEGSHDVHYTHPEIVAPLILKFLKDIKVFSKL